MIKNGPPQDPAMLKNVMAQEVDDAKKVREILARRKIGMEELPALVEAYGLSIGASDEADILDRILLSVISAKFPLPDINAVFALRQNMETYFGMSRDMPRIDPLEVDMERLVYLSGAGVNKDEIAREVDEVVKKHSLDRKVLYGGACSMAKLGLIPRAKDFLVLCSLLDVDLLRKINLDDDLEPIRKDSEFMNQLAVGKIRPPVEAEKGEGIEKVEIQYRWGGMGKAVDERRNLEWKKDRFFDAEQNIEIPAYLVNTLVKYVQDASPSKNFVTQITHFDDYPSLVVKIYKDPSMKPITFLSRSNTPGMIPFNVVSEGKLGIIDKPEFGKAIFLLQRWLSMKVGVPGASYYFGGSEIPMEGREPSSPEEILIKKEYGITETQSDAPLSPKFPMELPESIRRIYPQGKINQLKSYIPAEKQDEMIFIDRFVVENPKGQTSSLKQIAFLRTRNQGKEVWFLDSPKEFAESVDAIEKQVVGFWNGTPGEINIMPDMREIGPFGLPTGQDLMKTIRLLEMNGADFNALGKIMVPLRVVAEFKQLNDKVEGYYLPASRTLAIDFFKQNIASGSCEFAGILLDWCGWKNGVPADLKGIGFSNDAVHLFLSPSITASELEELKRIPRQAGHTIDDSPKDRIWIKPSDGSKLIAIIQPDGKVKFGRTEFKSR